MKLSLDSIRIDGGTQPRELIDEDLVSQYAEAMKEGAEFLVDLYNKGRRVDTLERWR